MPGIADDLVVLGPPQRIPIDIALGTCAIALTSSPFIFPPPGAKCWAILGDWLPADEPVGMLVTFRAYVPLGHAEQVREVHSVFAGRATRGHPDSVGHTLPVAIGRWMFKAGYLTLHSPDRTEAGDRWARAVGGKLPERDQVGTDENAVQSGQGALTLLNQHAWDVAPWPDPG